MSKHTVHVDLADRSYDIHIEAGLFKRCAEIIKQHVQGARCLIIADEQVAGLYADALLQQLRAADVSAELATFPAGEPHKSLTSAEAMWQQCAQHKIDRSSCLVALGGGVTGDLTGFVASCWMRGIPFIQIPTTLLAMVDSSVGGKTGVNSSAGKNLIGAFKQPATVIIDPQLLQSMDAREYAAGLAEVIKYGVIYDEEFFKWMEVNASALQERDNDALTHAIAESCKIKAHYVVHDEQERGIRAHLNYGHTFGHALERHTAYKEFLHGEAVGIGMRMAVDLSQRIGLLENDTIAERQDQLLAIFNLPQSMNSSDCSADSEALTAYCSLDKKVSKGKTRFILVRNFAQIEIVEAVDEAAVRSAFEHGLLAT